MKNIIILLLIVTSSLVGAQVMTTTGDTTDLNVVIVLDGYELSFSKSAIVNENTRVIVNGPLTNHYGEMVGGYIYRGHQIKPFVPPTIGKTINKPNGVDNNFNGHNHIYGRSDNGIFGKTKSGNLVLVPYYDWIKSKNTYKFEWAFQNGRMLVLNGRNIHNSASKNKLSYRTGIGFLPDGRLIYIMRKIGDMTLWEFAELFIRNGCSNAIYLDGNISLCGYNKFIYDSTTKTDSFGLEGNAMKIHFSL